MSLLDEKQFKDIFGGHDDNKSRRKSWEIRRGPWLMKYEHNGDIGWANARTRQGCRQRALIKCGGDDYTELEMITQDQFFAGTRR